MSFDPSCYPFHRYGDYLRARFGRKVHKVCVDAGFSCPNRDGRVGDEGCIFCNPRGFNPNPREMNRSVGEQTQLGVTLLRRKVAARDYIAYFQPYTNTDADVEALRDLYEEALAVDGVVGLAVGTRPDCVPEPVLDLLASLARDHYVQLELGLQSGSDDSLGRIRRGHDVAAFEDAMRRSRGRGFDVCVHLVFGLPGETEADWMRSVQRAVGSGATGLKIHNLHVTRGTELERMYREQMFELPELDAYVKAVVDCLEVVPPEVTIQRLWGASGTKELHIAPDWCMDPNRVKHAIEQEFAVRGSWQGARCAAPEAL